MSKGFIYNLNKCVGCNACVVACSIENNTALSINYRKVNTFNALQFPGLPLYYLSLACNHCDEAPCVAGCPSTALQKNMETGIVTIDAKVCIGCKYCTWTCPYDAPKFNVLSRVVEKCNLCESTVLNGGLPACVHGCPTGALKYEEVERNRTDAAAFPQEKTQPRVQIIPSRKERSSAQITKLDSDAREAIQYELSKEIKADFSFKSEWSLITFTSLVAILFGWFTATVLSLSSIVHSYFESTKVTASDVLNVEPLVFVLLGASAGLISFLHLGKKLQALSAFRNLRSSWLSREIFFYAGFFVLSFYFMLFNHAELLGVLGVLAGLAMLISIDRVYLFSVRKNVLPMHSAQVLLSGLLFTFFFLETYPVFFALLALKFMLYGIRKVDFTLKNEPIRMSLSLLRVLFGFIVPVSLLLVENNLPSAHLIILISLIIGEFADRIEFYLELEIQSPKKQILDNLKKLIA